MFSASATVVGSVMLRVSGNFSTNSPDEMAHDPKRINGKDGKNWACKKKKCTQQVKK